MRISDWSSDVCSSDLFPAGPAEGDRAVDLVLDLDQRVQHHRAALVEIDLERVHARVFARVGIIAIDLERLDVLRFRSGLVDLALLVDLRVLGECEFSHSSDTDQYTRAVGLIYSTSSVSVSL